VELTRYFKPFLLILTLAFSVNFALSFAKELSAGSTYLFENGTPIGGDFINLHTAGRLILERDIATIYDPEPFMAVEQAMTGKPIGIRLWAYPPHSLLAAWPFGLIGFHAGLIVWSVLGVVVLTLGARRLGFDWWEIGILVLSPAALQSIYYGQTGNFFTGLLLLALATKRPGDPISAVSAALLTMKPQTGFLLPLLWLMQGRWRLILITSALTIALVGLALVVFGVQPWLDYVGKTLPLLSELEKYGSGPFMLMIPSVFMALRVLGVPGDPALYLHLGFAALVVVVLAIGLRRSKDPLNQAALLLLGTSLATPYLHSYDLGILLCGALLVLRGSADAARPARLALMLLVVLAWALPNLLIPLNGFKVPLSPLIILALFGVAFAQARR
jgi:hypothetical protein